MLIEVNALTTTLSHHYDTMVTGNFAQQRSCYVNCAVYRLFTVTKLLILVIRLACTLDMLISK